MIERCLIVDTETTRGHELLELGMILYSVTNQTVLEQFSTLLPALRNDAEDINGIKSLALLEMMECYDEDFSGILFTSMCNRADVFVAHNVEFDRRVITGWFHPEWSASAMDGLIDKPWVCTMEDFQWPKGRAQGSLTLLALDNGVGVLDAHRALTDCRLIASLFDRMDNLQDMFRVAMRPKALFIGKQPFEDNHLATNAGFKWDRLVPNAWSRRMAIADTILLPFEVERIDEP